MKSRFPDFLSSLLTIIVIGAVFYFVFHHSDKPGKPYTSQRHRHDSLHGIDTLAIVAGDTVFTLNDTIIDR